MSTSSAHADSEKAFLWQIEPFSQRIEEEWKRPSWKGKLEQKDKNTKDDNVIGRMMVWEQKVLRNKMNCTKYLKTFMTKHHWARWQVYHLSTDEIRVWQEDIFGFWEKEKRRLFFFFKQEEQLKQDLHRKTFLEFPAA